jgi:hypothetical protein
MSHLSSIAALATTLILGICFFSSATIQTPELWAGFVVENFKLIEIDIRCRAISIVEERV